MKTDRESGELLIRTPCRMLGYLDAPDLTAAAFTDDGFFKTGDLATIHPDGSVELIGRAKELINRAGNKVSPLEVERALMTHPGVAAALATGRHGRRDDVELRQAPCLTLTSPEELAIQLDGDPFRVATPLEIGFAEDRLRVLVPTADEEQTGRLNRARDSA